MRISFFPNERGNPYLDLLEGGLRQVGVEVYPAEVRWPRVSWLKPHRGRVDVLHLHWLEHIYHRETYRKSLIRVLRFAVQLAYARRLGYRIVWTVHNLYPHERPYPHLDRWVRRIVVHAAHAVLVHCQAGRDLLASEFGRRRSVYVAPHGSYVGAYPAAVARAAARRQLGIEAGFVFLFLGQIRAYKAIEELVRAFAAVPDPGAALLVVGKIPDPHREAGMKLVREIADEKRAILRVGWIPAGEIPVYYGAADVAVCPYRDVLTSGSALLALSMGRPVVAPALGCLPELITPQIGVLYDPERPYGLREALVGCMALDLDTMGQNALHTARGYDWQTTAETTRRAYTGD